MEFRVVANDTTSNIVPTINEAHREARTLTSTLKCGQTAKVQQRLRGEREWNTIALTTR